MQTSRFLHLMVLPLLVGCALLAAPIGSAADTVPRVKPSAGDYEAAPKKLTNDLYQVGSFSVVNEGGKRRIVATEALSAIAYPYQGKCDVFNNPLTAESIPVSKKGRFSIRDKTKVKGGSILVVWKGAWSKPTRVAGTLKIAFKGCSSKIKWVGKRTAG